MFGFLSPKRRIESEVQAGDDVKVVLDLDQLQPKPIGFVLHGKRHIVKPVSVGLFGEIYEEASRLDRLAQEKKIKPADAQKAYVKALKPICPTLTREDLENMTREQQTMFFMFVFKTMSGEAFSMAEIGKDEKKN